jgi:hypothetical protein
VVDQITDLFHTTPKVKTQQVARRIDHDRYDSRSDPGINGHFHFVYYEWTKREIKIKPIDECRCDERLKTKVEESTHLGYTGFLGELEHLEIETRLIDEMLVSVRGEYVFFHYLGHSWTNEVTSDKIRQYRKYCGITNDEWTEQVA